MSVALESTLAPGMPSRGPTSSVQICARRPKAIAIPVLALLAVGA